MDVPDPAPSSSSRRKPSRAPDSVKTTTVRVRLFGALAEGAGSPAVDLSLDVPTTGTAVLQAVRRSWPQLAGLVDRSQLAVNLEVVSPQEPIRGGDEIALLPPVAGGAHPTVLVGLRDDRLPIDEAVASVAADAAGATVLFLGTVRDHAEGSRQVERLEYHAYREMAELVMSTIAGEVVERWREVCGIALLHALGDLPVGAPTIAIACSAPHRDDAFSACRYALEEVKDRVSVWKREVSGGVGRWVGAKGGP